MSINHWRKTSRQPKEAGQAILFVLLAMGFVLLGAVAFSVDLGNLWFHRQSAQTAADAACTAGAMDLLIDNTNSVTTQGGFTAGAAFDCSVHPTYAPCKYAAFNGYNSNISAGSTSQGNNVYVSFPAAVTGVPAGSASFPPAALAPHPFIRVDVLDNAQTYFSGLLSGKQVQPVRALAVCGTVLAQSPIPIIVLHPTKSGALHFNGTPTIDILGGASRSIQVNSSSSSAIDLGGHGGVVLECGGKLFTGSSLGVFGGPTSQSSSSGTCPTTGGVINTASLPTGGGFYPGADGTWGNGAPISDPFSQITAPTCTTTCPPSVPTDPDVVGNATCNTSAKIVAGTCVVAHNVHGCPDTQCKLFTAGYYPSSICIGTGGACGGSITTALFDPGVYYIKDGLALKQQSVVRPGTGAGDGSAGTMFYLTGSSVSCSGQTGLVCVGANAGKTSGIDKFDTTRLRCPGPPLGPAPDPTLGIPALLDGSMLLAPCTGIYGDPLGKYRGMLFFQDRSSSVGGGWGGGGGFLLAGNIYFHQSSSFGSSFTLQGGSSGSSYVLGEIVTDTLNLGGNSAINMALNPNASYSVLKATLLR
jgi:hypothetical protein